MIFFNNYCIINIFSSKPLEDIVLLLNESSSGFSEGAGIIVFLGTILLIGSIGYIFGSRSPKKDDKKTKELKRILFEVLKRQDQLHEAIRELKDKL